MHVQKKLTAFELNQSSQHFHSLHFLLNLSTLTWIAIVAGICLRLFHFFYNRSLWTDEAYLSNSIIRMDFLRLAAPPLEYEQKAPIGFLWTVKLCVLAFGKKEMALRLFPLICSITSLFVFKRVAGYFLKPVGVLIALAILAISPPIIYYAVEAKQYATDLLATCVALYLYLHYHQRKDFSALLLWGLGGAFIIWFSYPAIFILAGMAFALCLHHLIKKDWQSFFRGMLPFSIWLLSFAVNYLLFTHKHADSQWLIEWFGGHKSFMPLPPNSLKDMTWFISMPLSMLHFALGLSWLDLSYNYAPFVRSIARMPLLPLLGLALGAVIFFRQDKKHFLVITFPFLLAMLASGLKMYPLFERLFLFLAPLLILFIARGYQQILISLPDRRWKYIIPVLLLAGAAGNSLYTFLRPANFGRHVKNMTGREVLLYVNDNVQEGDGVYIYWNFEPIYRYYKEAYHLKYEAVVGQDVRSASKNAVEYSYNLTPDITKLLGYKRVWLVYNKYRRFTIGDYTNKPAWYHSSGFHPGQVVHHKLSEAGKVVDNYQTREVNVSLFKLTNE